MAASVNNIKQSAEQSAEFSSNVSNSTQEQLSTMQEVKDASSSLGKTAEEPQGLVAKFKLRMIIMDINFTGKNVLITGSSKGIGKAIALGFAQHGANILINYIGDEQEAEAVRVEAEKLGVKALIFHADVSNSQEVQAMHQFMDEHLGNLDILVNNAGFAQGSSITDLTDEQWDRMIKVHLYGCFYNCREAAKE